MQNVLALCPPLQLPRHRRQPQKGATKSKGFHQRDWPCLQYDSVITNTKFQHRRQQQQHASSSPHAARNSSAANSKTPRYLSYLRILVTPSMSAMLTAGAAAGGTLTRNLLAGGRYFTPSRAAVDVAFGGARDRPHRAPLHALQIGLLRCSHAPSPLASF